ncbi:MAG TPA: tetratricopeptide repeat protein, partial [Thermodesulfovibrionales bacterium]|nr:tetratricopeptide repeat protein [Thermodesulfovibrionales bacterium]
FYHEMRTEEAFRKALECFQKAVEIDSGYALAYSGIADIYFYLGVYKYDDYNASIEKAKEAAKKASDIDDSSADVQNTLGLLSGIDLHYEEAERHYKQAIELNPRYAPARHSYSYLLSHLGRHEEAIHQATTALELDPLSEPMTRGDQRQL